MRNKIVNVKLSFVCPESWNKMNERRDGRFCSKCSRTIKDFRNKTNEDFQKEISLSQGPLCGHFDLSQMTSSFAKYAAAALLATFNACAPEQITPTADQPEENSIELDEYTGVTGVVFDLSLDEDSIHHNELYQPPTIEINENPDEENAIE